MSEVENYVFLQTSDNKFLVSISIMLKCDNLIPKFLQVYEVKEITKRDYMFMLIS